MVRLTRAQQQERTRAAVLDAARDEFIERGYPAAKVDGIAERAELTRGAVYSNFPSKRALYLAVLVDMVEHGATSEQHTDALPPPAAPSISPISSVSDALGAFARTWLERMPLADGSPSLGRLHPGSPAGILDDEPIRDAFGQLTRVEALLLALALESYAPADASSGRQVRRARLVLRLLDGPGASANPALQFGDPFDIVLACAHLGGLDLADEWDPPHLPYVRQARACRDRWAPPPELRDLLTHRPVGFTRDGVITFLGTHRLEAAEEAVRAARTGDRVTVAVTTADPAETGRLVQLRTGEFARCLRRVFEPGAWPRLRLVLDEGGLLASAAGVPDADDGTEYAVRVRDGDIVARAGGRGAAHAATTFGQPAAADSPAAPDGTPSPPSGRGHRTPGATS
ncbi:TetR/AcrR family transcriptional regulator [Streptomyces uncialis]|uniref:TetR/AcrR family transcriptional regulator n=1 Tax=Streptomyces uncialis TaxID=1048205 RepID=UPI00365E687F